MKRWLVVLAACAQPAPRPAPVPSPAPPVVVAPPPDAPPGPTQEERLAAIQKAMNDLKNAAQRCWARVATERFDVEGSLEATIDIPPVPGRARADLANDTTHNAKLAACMKGVLETYGWAPPLHGQTIRLPFRWRAPDGQNVIERMLVDTAAQGKISVGVLLDENNDGNAAASMLEVGIEAGGSTGLRRAERTELWYFQSWKPDEFPELDVVVSGPKLPAVHVGAGDMLYVPAGAVRQISVTGGDKPDEGRARSSAGGGAEVNDKYHSALRAVVVIVPGGREGTARSGALPTPEATTGGKAPVVLHRNTAKRAGPALIYLDATIVKDTPLAASLIDFPKGMTVPEHVHAHETELLYTGSHFGDDTVVGELTVAGVTQQVTDHAVVQIPPNTRHAFTATLDSFALQIYTPAGPEQRFKK